MHPKPLCTGLLAVLMLGMFLQPAASTSTSSGPIVFAYLPYWSAHLWRQLDFSTITTLAIAGGTPQPEQVAHCQALGIKVVWMPLPEAFDNTRIRDTRYVDQWIATQVQIAVRYGLDGVQVDIEGLTSDAAYVTALVAKMRAQLNAALPTSELSFALNSKIRNGWVERGYDPVALAQYLDYIVIMAYDTQWGVQPASPNIPMSALQASLDDFLLYYRIPASQLVVALPFYGYAFVCSGSAQPSGPCMWTGSHSTLLQVEIYQIIQSQSPAPVIRSHSPSQSVYIQYYASGAWRQVWFDDDRTIAAKSQYAAARGVRGVGVWAATYNIGMSGNTGVNLWTSLTAPWAAVAASPSPGPSASSSPAAPAPSASSSPAAPAPSPSSSPAAPAPSASSSPAAPAPSASSSATPPAACLGCFIDNQCFESEALHPSLPCLRCDVTQSAVSWSQKPSGTYCFGGDCGTELEVCNGPGQNYISELHRSKICYDGEAVKKNDRRCRRL